MIALLKLYSLFIFILSRIQLFFFGTETINFEQIGPYEE